MRMYRTTLTLASPSATPWHADTVFGHFCWCRLRQEGPDTLNAFLRLYESPTATPPVLLSDGFPAEFLPRPLLPPARTSDPSKRKRLEFLFKAKRAARAEWLTLDEFNAVRRGDAVSPSLTEELIKSATRRSVTPKNQIDRRTDTAGGDAGELYDMPEFVLPRVTFYWRISDDHVQLVREFLDDLKTTGYGKRKSIGYGNVADYTLDEFNGFAPVPNANAFVTLSRFVPAPGDPTDGFWETVVKYGKLGEEWAVAGNPFKRPLLQLCCGSCFRDLPPREWYGQLVDGLSPTRPEVKQYAFAFALPMRLPDFDTKSNE